jgi:DNA processing protein
VSDSLFYLIALSAVPQIGPVQARLLLQHFSPAEIFRAKPMELQRIQGIGSERARAIRQFKEFSVAEAELRFIEKQGIEAIPFNDPRYPQRLSNCYDPPILLFYRGTAVLNAQRMLAIIGTRQPSDYGARLTEQIVEELTQSNIVIVSGLAQGIDAIAHRSAMKQQLQTIGVLAHGLDRIYPHHHRRLAQMMCDQGGLLTEFRQQTVPDRYHFPARNRIVAGMTDATLVIESGEKGGSLITAGLANQYHRDVYAVPGRTEDPKSNGCLRLIRNHQAEIFISTQDLLTSLGWADETKPGRTNSGIPFAALNEEEIKILTCLKSTDPTPQDVIGWETNLPVSKLSSILLQLEMKGVVVSLPGKQFRLRS